MSEGVPCAAFFKKPKRVKYSIAALMFLIAIGSLSCKKNADERLHCWKAYSKIPGTVNFVGFSAADLDTIFVNTCVPGTRFTQVSRRDTFVGGDVRMKHDTGSISGDKFISLWRNTDYEVILPFASDTFRISDISYHGDSLYYYTTEASFCDMKGTPLWPPDSATVNGQRVKLGRGVGPLAAAYLVK